MSDVSLSQQSHVLGGRIHERVTFSLSDLELLQDPNPNADEESK
jgi:hypothetical protein